MQSKSHEYKAEDWLTPEWEKIKVADQTVAKDSGLPLERLRGLGKSISKLPEDEEFHKLVRKIFDARLKSIEDGHSIDWGTAEALAFASLI